jgi:hypothetical protein
MVLSNTKIDKGLKLLKDYCKSIPKKENMIKILMNLKNKLAAFVWMTLKEEIYLR